MQGPDFEDRAQGTTVALGDAFCRPADSQVCQDGRVTLWEPAAEGFCVVPVRATQDLGNQGVRVLGGHGNGLVVGEFRAKGGTHDARTWSYRNTIRPSRQPAGQQADFTVRHWCSREVTVMPERCAHNSGPPQLPRLPRSGSLGGFGAW